MCDVKGGWGQVYETAEKISIQIQTQNRGQVCKLFAPQLNNNIPVL